LTPAQVITYFLAGYTSKLAGTEMGITQPVATFSACFGAAFLPLPRAQYAQLLKQKIEQHNANVWLLNTGWTGGAYGLGSRIKLAYTRAMIEAALTGKLDAVDYQTHPIFGLQMPTTCPNVPAEILNPVQTWTNSEAYEQQAQTLANLFEKHLCD
ncbi:MAG: phosphoenolpyruvate carboxykinase (ATP), partial [Microcoleus sp. PH2017_19_SFW_U_A]|nr:phosphoenolpyruvate carboxykinase (ATP) [Microcoleus sp. PH2017_19_SFW_U_A]